MPPALAARGLCSAETLAPGDDKTKTIALKADFARAWTFRTLSSPNDTWRPAERDEAKATTSSTGKFRSERICSISRPTLPVAPTTATLYPMAGGDRRPSRVLQTLVRYPYGVATPPSPRTP